MNRVIRYNITDNDDNIKVYTFLKGRKGYSTRLIRTLKTTENGITLNGDAVKTVDIIHSGDILCVSIPCENSEIEPADIPIDIIYEDDDVLVVNKSPFLAMHPTHNHQGDTLANAVVAHLVSEGKNTAYMAIGRLDKGTSGLVVLALNQLSACKLSGKIKKQYEAIVKGQPDDKGTVNVPIYRPDPMKTLRACSPELGEEYAVTNWHVTERYDGCARVELSLETGRTHQIRVHMSYIGHPLAGDSYYGDFHTEIGHQLLCCKKCEFVHPVSEKLMLFELNNCFKDELNFMFI